MTIAAGATTEPTARAKSMLRNVAYAFHELELDLGDPALLISLERAEIIAMRDAITE